MNIQDQVITALTDLSNGKYAQAEATLSDVVVHLDKSASPRYEDNWHTLREFVKMRVESGECTEQALTFYVYMLHTMDDIERRDISEQ